MEEAVHKMTVLAIPVLIAITFHEAAHGYVALKCGDETAYRMGRVTFNPFRHVDPIGTVLVPLVMFLTSGFLFGWAKPVPVNFRNLNNPRRDMVWVALAGPGINIGLALLSAWLLRWVHILPDTLGPWAEENLVYSVLINVILAVFNMLPLPPLDGGRVAVGLLPTVLARPLARLEHWGMFILIGVLFIVPMVGAQLGLNWSVLPWLLWYPVESIISLIDRLMGPI